jgi:hypothetical protein
MKALVIVFTVIVLSFPAVAQKRYEEQTNPGAPAVGDTTERLNIFRQLDANGDGWLSKSEAAKRREVAANFERADANRDGRLSLAEFESIALNRSDQPGRYRNPDRG